MPFEELRLDALAINRANDRHGELENETAAIAELFRLREQHMRNLAADIVNEHGIYDTPLVGPDGDRFIIYDGNRRVTCLKLIANPNRAPSQDLQRFFQQLQDQWPNDFPEYITCQLEADRDVIDAILFRRHTGSQGGIGQSDWDDRAKTNFIERTGRGGRVDVAVEVEALLEHEGRLPQNNLPRSTMNRLLSSEANRTRAGISVVGNRFRITHDRNVVINALARIASDLSQREVVLGDLWNNQGKQAYLNRLEVEGILPQENHLLGQQDAAPRRRAAPRGRPPVHPRQPTFIPMDAPAIAWRANQGRIRAIWEELQSLSLTAYPNGISALIRIMLEMAVDSYNENRGLAAADNLAQKVRVSSNDLLARDIIDQQYFDEIERLRQHSELISIRSMQRYVHSNNFAPLPNELIVYWQRLGRLIVACLNH